MRFFVLCSLVLLLAASAGAAQVVDLRDAERLAIERNLNLQAQTYATRAAAALVRRGFGIYDPVLQADLAAGETKRPFALGGVVSTMQTLQTRYRRYNFSLTQLLPSGADIILSFDNQRDDINPEPFFNPQYNSTAQLSLVQPLLRGFGKTVTEQEILFAVHDRNIAVQDLRQQAFQLLTDVRNAYYDVLRYRDEVAYRRTSIALAEQVLKENRARVRAGVLAPVEILEAEVGKQLRERDLLDSERAYQNALDQLTLLLNLPNQVEVFAEALAAPQIEVSQEEGVRAAFAMRADLMRNLQEIERLELSRKIAKNQLLPELNLTANYAHSGLEGDYGDTVSDLGTTDLRSWEVGFTFSYPLGNRAARNELLRTNLLLSSQESQLGQLREEIGQEIRTAIRDLEVNSKKIEVTELASRLAQERLDTLVKRQEVGLATTRDVLQGEEDLASARTDHIAALADYNQAITAYLRATGQLLDHEGIRLVGEVSPEGQKPLLNPE